MLSTGLQSLKHKTNWEIEEFVWRVDKQLRERVMSVSLPDNPLNENEINKLAVQKPQETLPSQTTCFLNLPAEIRSRIYEYSLAREDRASELIVPTPFKDELMALATQPALTRVSRRVRAETLQMFYANNTFVAYFENFDFSGLVRWILLHKFCR